MGLRTDGVFFFTLASSGHEIKCGLFLEFLSCRFSSFNSLPSLCDGWGLAFYGEEKRLFSLMITIDKNKKAVMVF